MNYDPKEFAKYPDIMNKEQMRIACHISKRTALYLLQSGLIPSECTGKKTRCYRIKKSDVIAFYRDRAQNPCRYIAPKGWYQYQGSKVVPHKIRILPEPIPEESMRQFYEDALRDEPDVWDVSMICAYTGYDRRAVGNWIRKGRLQTIMQTRKYYIPKCFLIDYLCSPEYWNIIRKSKKHVDTLWKIHALTKDQCKRQL